MKHKTPVTTHRSRTFADQVPTLRPSHSYTKQKQKPINHTACSKFAVSSDSIYNLNWGKQNAVLRQNKNFVPVKVHPMTLHTPLWKDKEWPKRYDFPEQQMNPWMRLWKYLYPHLVPVLKIPYKARAGMNPTAELGNKQGLILGCIVEMTGQS